MFGAILAIFAILSLALTLEARSRAARTALHRLAGTHELFSNLEARRGRKLALQAALVERSPIVIEALSFSNAAPFTPATVKPMVDRELSRLADVLDVDAVAVANGGGTLIGSGGTHGAAWPVARPAHDRTATIGGNGGERIERRGGGLFRVVSIPLRRGSAAIGELQVATALDDIYARELATLARADVALLLDSQVVGTTLPRVGRTALAGLVGDLPGSGIVDLEGRRYALENVLYLGPVRFYAVDAVDAGDGSVAGTSATTLALLAIGALLLGGGASFWVARGIARPIDTLAQQLRTMARARDFSRRLPVTGSSVEVDGLSDTFNQMMAAVASAEAQTELAYVGAIKALAAALDCRDPYTAGHSERVSTFSVMIGRQLRLGDDDIEVLRLGALLHDIGKIGIRDNVLTKAGPLTREEFDIIKTHPTLGAHILRQVPFLCRHLPIVELHHERPDGRGYPHGLLGHATPLLARIVHVADAFDAMTSARAYRGAQEASTAIAELWRYAGSQFDAQVVEAFVTAWSAAAAPADQAASTRLTPLLRFPDARPTGSEG